MSLPITGAIGQHLIWCLTDGTAIVVCIFCSRERVCREVSADNLISTASGTESQLSLPGCVLQFQSTAQSSIHDFECLSSFDESDDVLERHQLVRRGPAWNLLRMDTGVAMSSRSVQPGPGVLKKLVWVWSIELLRLWSLKQCCVLFVQGRC